MFFRFIRRQFNGNNVIRRVTSCRKNTTTCASLVNWASIYVGIFNIGSFNGFKPNNWHRVVQDFAVRFANDMFFLVPASAFQVETIDVHTDFGLFGEIVCFHDIEFETEFVDGDGEFTSVILKSSC